jgi:hypothetical protein
MRPAAVALLIAALPLLAMAQGTLYRCKAGDGRLSFQQMPCDAGAQGEQLPAREVPVTTMGDNILLRTGRNAQGRGQTTEADMIEQLGHPSVTNVDIVNGVETRQHVYRYPDGSARYVYTRNGVVWAAQVRPGERRPDPQPCYTAAEIRDAEFAATSLRLSAEQRSEGLRQVQQMRQCRR